MEVNIQKFPLLDKHRTSCGVVAEKFNTKLQYVVIAQKV